MDAFMNSAGNPVLMGMVYAIQKNKAHLSEIDGLIGDGDHGANMNKGFTMFAGRISDDVSFTDGLGILGTLLFTEIGGSMGPIYGTMFSDMSAAGNGLIAIGTAELATMLDAALQGLFDIVDARVGDKTLVDTLSPAVDVLKAAAKSNQNLTVALPRLKAAAEAGRDSTKMLVAKFGRSSRLGERSRGVLDAGAVSCCLLLSAMADGILDFIG